MIKNYMAIGPPLLGSVKILKVLLSGMEDFYYFGGLIGLKYEAASKIIS